LKPNLSPAKLKLKMILASGILPETASSLSAREGLQAHSPSIWPLASDSAAQYLPPVDPPVDPAHPLQSAHSRSATDIQTWLQPDRHTRL
jgi:hypothetical protein